MDKFSFKIVTIDQSEDADLSSAADILGYQVIGVIVPTGFDAANVTFYVAVGGTFYLVSGLTLTAPTANTITLLNTGAVAPFVIPTVAGEQVKVATSQVQTADRSIILLLQKLP